VEKQLNKGQTELFEEAKIRGLCAAISADMESLLFRLILYCIIDDSQVAFREFSKMTMGGKIHWAQKDLKKYHNAKYLEHKEDFKWLWQFNGFRGQLIHCDFVWKDEGYNEFDVLDIQLVNDEWRIVPITYTKQDVAKRLGDFGQMIKKFGETTLDIIKVVTQKYPELIKPSNAL
jgi:hypothetical protein